MKLLLDIDGVMLHAIPHKKVEFMDDNFMSFDPKCVSFLNKILLITKIDIVLISSHRFTYSVSEWVNIFNKRGVSITNIEISEFIGNNRTEEICEWVKHNVDDYIIIDDNRLLNDLPMCIKENLYSTSPYIGLNSEVTYNIICDLNERSLNN